MLRIYIGLHSTTYLESLVAVKHNKMKGKCLESQSFSVENFNLISRNEFKHSKLSLSATDEKLIGFEGKQMFF